MDPEGKGHRGKAAISAFHDLFKKSMKSLDFDIHKTALCGDEVAAYITLHITTQEDQTFSVDVLNIYRQAPNGKLASLRSFWEGG
jgi:steroid delta-isomerase